MTSIHVAPPKKMFQVQKTKLSRLSEVDFNNLPFGRIFADHMFVMDYHNGQWQQGTILPFGNLELSPATSALHYGQAIFEGIKANIDQKTKDILLFRVEENAKRFNLSAYRMGMPTLPEDIFVNAVVELLKLDRNWVPPSSDSSMYIRPFMFASDDCVGVRPSDNYKFVVINSPVGPYYSKPIKVVISDKYVRAFDGGTGEAKAAGNYGATMYPVSVIRKNGYDQILWTDGKEHKYVEEIGTMNVFFAIDDEVLTPSLDGTILRGITRDSIIKLFRDKGVKVTERRITIAELFEAHAAGKLQDAFGAGTAATITHIEEMLYKDQQIFLPPAESRSYSTNIKKDLEGIKRGLLPDKYNWNRRI